MQALAIATPAHIPLWLKIVYTAFMCVLIPVYWKSYGPRNFLYFCDVALLVTLAGIWMENRLLISMQAVAIVLPQILWIVDFLSFALVGKGSIGMTAYMFNPSLSLFARGLSLFHGWLPFLLIYLVWQLGYDRRAFVVQSICGITLLLVCYFFMPVPPPPASDPGAAVNINYVYGFSNTEPQHWMHPHLWLAMLLVAFPVVLYLPAHFVLSRLFGAAREMGALPAGV